MVTPSHLQLIEVQHPPCLESTKALEMRVLKGMPFFLLQPQIPIIVARFLGEVFTVQFFFYYKLHEVMNYQSFVASYDELNYLL